MYARLRFEAVARRSASCCRPPSLTITDKGAFVYIAEGDTARRVPVTFRLVDGDTVEILSGLEPASKVVVAGANLLGDKSQIRIID